MLYDFFLDLLISLEYVKFVSYAIIAVETALGAQLLMVSSIETEEKYRRALSIITFYLWFYF